MGKETIQNTPEVTSIAVPIHHKEIEYQTTPLRRRKPISSSEGPRYWQERRDKRSEKWQKVSKKGKHLKAAKISEEKPREKNSPKK